MDQTIGTLSLSSKPESKDMEEARPALLVHHRWDRGLRWRFQGCPNSNHSGTQLKPTSHPDEVGVSKTKTVRVPTKIARVHVRLDEGHATHVRGGAEMEW